MPVEPEHPIDPSGVGAQAAGGFVVEVFETPDLAAETRQLPPAVEADLNAFADYFERLGVAAEANPDGPEARGLERTKALARAGGKPLGIGELLSTVATSVATERVLITENNSRG